MQMDKFWSSNISVPDNPIFQILFQTPFNLQVIVGAMDKNVKDYMLWRWDLKKKMKWAICIVAAPHFSLTRQAS